MPGPPAQAVPDPQFERSATSSGSYQHPSGTSVLAFGIVGTVRLALTSVSFVVTFLIRSLKAEAGNVA